MSMSRDGTDPVELGSEPDGTELLGTVIADRYQLETVLGRGGMGLVYQAQHMGLRRKVAVKILHPALAASHDVRNRFEREAFAAGKIDHPNCINVMDSGKLPDGTRYLAMELLDGKSLADVLEGEGQVAAGRALHILAGILRGLGHIHQAGLIHRDIKPENIFLIRQGADEDFAKILDFGIAKGMGKSDLDEGVKLTQAGMAFGTPIYMAPEQALGNPMDGRADLYAAAIIGYEMLTGQPPFYSEDKLEVMSMHTAKPVPPMRQRLLKGAKPVPSSIERLIVKGLTKKPSERYATAEIFLAAVEAALDTPDGGVTDVQFERPTGPTRRPASQPRASSLDSTGSQPLVTSEGHVDIPGEEHGRNSAIADAISDVLSTPPPQPIVKPPVVAPIRDSAPRGGIGIGLPYTGPSGEPIFGLTPEQRLAQAGINVNDRSLSIANALEPDEGAPATTPVVKPTRKRWQIYAAVAGAAVVLGIIIAVLTVPRGGPDEPEQTVDPETPAGKAHAALKSGRVDEAEQILLANKSILEKDAEMQLVLGHVRSAQGSGAAAVTAYRNALNLNFTFEKDVELRGNLRSLADDRDPAVVQGAFNLWARTSDPDGKKALYAAAVAQDPDRRHAVEPVVRDLKLDANVEWWRAYLLDLQQIESCGAWKETIIKLRALGQNAKPAVPILQSLLDKRSRTSYKVRVYQCVHEELKGAITALSGSRK